VIKGLKATEIFILIVTSVDEKFIDEKSSDVKSAGIMSAGVLSFALRIYFCPLFLSVNFLIFLISF